jgi:hypothetical protein
LDLMGNEVSTAFDFKFVLLNQAHLNHYFLKDQNALNLKFRL